VLKHGYGSYKQIIEDEELWSGSLVEEEKIRMETWRIPLKKIVSGNEEIFADQGAKTVDKSCVISYIHTRLKFIMQELKKTLK